MPAATQRATASGLFARRILEPDESAQVMPRSSPACRPPRRNGRRQDPKSCLAICRCAASRRAVAADPEGDARIEPMKSQATGPFPARPCSRASTLRARAQHRHPLAVGIEGDLVESLVVDNSPATCRPMPPAPSPSGPSSLRRPCSSISFRLCRARIDEQLAMVSVRRACAARSPMSTRPRPAQALHRHPVLRQRAGLVAADGRRRSQGLDGRQVTHQRVAFACAASPSPARASRRSRPSGTLRR